MDELKSAVPFQAPESDFMEDIISTGRGWGVVLGWFKHIAFIVNFISNLTPLLLW